MVTGPYGSPAANGTTLTVIQSVTVLTPPASATNALGTSVGFGINATGTILGYQWFKGTVPLNGQTSNSLTLNNISTTNAGTYSVVVSGACNNVTNSATLMVDLAPTVYAGTNQVLVWVEGNTSISANLTGNAWDDGLPFGTLTTTWNQVNGPGTVTFVPVNSTNATASFTPMGPTFYN